MFYDGTFKVHSWSIHVFASKSLHMTYIPADTYVLKAVMSFNFNIQICQCPYSLICCVESRGSEIHMSAVTWSVLTWDACVKINCSSARMKEEKDVLCCAWWKKKPRLNFLLVQTPGLYRLVLLVNQPFWLTKLVLLVKPPAPHHRVQNSNIYWF